MKRITVTISLIMLLLGLSAGAFSVETPRPALIRLHILANSNREEDQLVKYRLRDQLLTMMGEKLKGAASLDESRRVIVESLEEIEDYAQKTLLEYGQSQDVRVYHGFFDFPTRYYGAFALPAGNYEALRVVIGNGEGANWWCVLFPPLCFVNGQTIKDDTEENTVKVIKDSLEQKKVVRFKPAFKIMELLNRD